MSKTEKLDELLSDWLQLNKTLMHLAEPEVAELLKRERATRCRLRIMLRIYNRFSKLRSQREKLELAQDVKA